MLLADDPETVSDKVARRVAQTESAMNVLEVARGASASSALAEVGAALTAFGGVYGAAGAPILQAGRAVSDAARAFVDPGVELHEAPPLRAEQHGAWAADRYSAGPGMRSPPLMVAKLCGVDLRSAREASGAAAATAAVHSFAELVTEVLGERVEVHDISPLGVVVLRGSFRAAQEWSKLVTDPTGPLRTSRFRPDPTFPPLFHPHVQDMRGDLREKKPEAEFTRSAGSLEVHWR